MVVALLDRLTEPQAEQFGFFTTALAEEENNDNMLVEKVSTSETSETTDTSHTGSRKFAVDFMKFKNIDRDALFKKFLSKNKATRVELLAEIQPVFMHTTFYLWEAIQKKDRTRQVNAAIKKSHEPKAIETATEQVTLVVDKIDITNLPKELEDYINKIIEGKIQKAKTTAKKGPAKKLWGGRQKPDVDAHRKWSQSKKGVLRTPSFLNFDPQGQEAKGKKEDSATEGHPQR